MEPNTAEASAPAPQHPSFLAGAQNFSIGTQSIATVRTQNNVESVATMNNVETVGTLNNFTVERQIIELRTDEQGAFKLNPIRDASYARDRKLSPPDSSCLPGTRKKVLKKIVRWVNSKSSLLKKSRILWLYGYVGCGKSAIAQAIALKFADNERLAASFFFFRGSGDRSKTTRFAATIASQVAAAIPSTAPLIHDALRAEEGLLQPTVPLTIQFQRLVYGPIVKATKWDLLRKPFLIVLDGLDECHDKEEISAFIEHSVGFFEKNPHIPLRLFISSRVEEHIRTRLYGSSQVRMMNLVSHTTRQDILTAFRASFDQAARYSRVIQAYGEWPSPEDLTRLVDHVDGSFIFMATIVKFIIGNPDDNPPPLMRLNLALNMNPGLDGLYTETLMRCQHLDSWDKIIWTLSLMKEPMSILQLAHILALKTFQVIAVLVNLHSIFQVPGDDTTPVSFCHSSLVEFLNTESRSGIFKAPQHHANTLAYRCVEIIGNPNEAGPASDYALSHWEEHWIESCKPSDTEARKRLSDVFLSHMRSFMPSFEDIVGTYVLMDLTILSPRERIACKAIRDLGEHRTDGDGSVLAEFLGRSAPVSHTSLVVKVLRAGWPKLQDPLDTRDMWRDPWLSLPDKRPFLRHTLSLASTRLAALAPLPDIDGALKSSSSIYMTHHGETPLAFAWSFLSWVELYIAVVNYEGRIPWHTLYDIPIISNLAHPDPIVLRLLCHLNKAESTVARDRFVNSVKSAIHLSKDVSESSHGGDFEGPLWQCSSQWEWKFKEGSGWHFLMSSKGLSPFGLLAGFNVLVKCLERTCSDLHGKKCPVHA